MAIDFDAPEYQPLNVDGGTRHAVVVDGKVENVILWDGTTPIDLDGDLVPLTDEPIGPGDTVAIRKGKPELVAKAEPVEREPSIEDRIAALESKADTQR